MPLYVESKSDVREANVFSQRLSDYPNGLTVVTAELSQSVLYAGTPLGIANGFAHVVKVAKLTAAAAADTKVYTVAKGHNFKVGDAICLAIGGAAKAITAIATNATDSTSDDITVSATIGTVASAGAAVYQAAAEGASAAFKYAPIALLGESYDVKTNMDVNAVLAGVVIASAAPFIGDAVKSALPNIQFI